MRKNWLDILFFIGVLLMVVISAVILFKTFEKKEIISENIEVVAEVLESPNSCEDLGRRPPYSKIKYRDKVFIKKTGNNICHLVSQKKFVKMYSNKNGDEIIFLEEYDPMQFLYAILIFVIAVGISIRKFYSKKTK